MTRRHKHRAEVLGVRFQSPLESALAIDNTRVALAALADPIRSEPVMTTAPAHPVPSPGPQQQPSPLRLEVDALTRTVGALAGQVADLTDQVRDQAKELAALRATSDADETNERIVAFLEGLGGVKMSGISIAQNLAVDNKSIHSRLARLATQGRVTVHREKNRHALYSVPLR